ncbi:hypothetical protein [Rugamonas sp.]|uniref:hypothetical protein n=1 Tax=Rugamonas sp. TaxID=1926287 RepID=UPI0025DF1D64|nr:hypothetical protein [Rugamonas sp.]
MRRLVLLALAVLTGCASMQQAVNGYAAAAAVSMRAAEDENIRVWTADACGTPYAAALRPSRRSGSAPASAPDRPA